MAGQLSGHPKSGATLDAAPGRLAFAGRLDADGIGALWHPAIDAARREAGDLVLDLSRVEACDTAGTTLLLAVEQAHQGEVRMQGAGDAVVAILARARAASVVPMRRHDHGPDMRAAIAAGLRMAVEGIAFLGEAALAMLRLPGRRRMLRVREMARYADQAGVRSIPLILLLGFLFGLILAFQSAVAMRQFGAELYVANLVAISVLRELGPLLAAVILSGRTGSAYAAEIGTMAVNEEIAALRTMGMDPMTMLVLPRLAAAMAVMPAMTLLLDVAAMAGMAAVMVALGFPIEAVATQVRTAAKLRDLYGALFKAVCFGAAVAAVGCRAGLSTGVGPRAVGQSATAAVVGGIVSVVLLDGVFAVVFYRLGL